MKYRALVVHSDPALIETIKKSLNEMASLEFETFVQEEAALNWLLQNDKPFDFVFINWSTGRQNRTLLHSLRSLETTKKALVFRVASQQDLDWVGAIFELGAQLDNVLVKPFPPDALKKTLHNALKSEINTHSVVLLVDDDPNSREVIKQYLEHLGFAKIVEASDGAEALEALKENKKISVIVSDWEMPNMNGIQLLKEVRKSKFAKLPFVMVTSQTSIEEIKNIQAAEEGVDGYLNKPFNLQSFKGQMQSIFQGINKHREEDSLVLQARALLAHQKFAEATTLLQETIEKNPNSAPLYEALGDSLSSQEDAQLLNQASRAYEKALKLAPSRASLVMKYFDLQLSLGNSQQAIQELKAHLGAHGLDDQLRTRLAKAYFQNGMYDLAIGELERIINLNPSNAEAQSLYQITLSIKNEKKAG